jgi:hypothetical protein
MKMVESATDLVVALVDKPGTLAMLGEGLGKAGVNMEGMCGFPVGGEGIIHILVEDAAAARKAIEGLGYEVRGEREVLVADIEDRPGAFGRLIRPIADAGVNLDLAYLATRTRVVLGTSDPDKVKGLL